MRNIYLGVVDVRVDVEAELCSRPPRGLAERPVEHPVGDEALLGVKILVVVRPHHGVRVDHDAVLLEEKIDVRVEALLAACKNKIFRDESLIQIILYVSTYTLTFSEEDEDVASGFEVLLQVVDLVLRELLPRPGHDEDPGLAQQVHRDHAVLAVARDLPVPCKVRGSIGIA